MGFKYTRNSINNIAGKCHEMMGLSAPITLEKLKIAIQNMGIVLTAKPDMACHADDVVTSSPTCRGGEASQPRQVWFSFDNTTVLSISELSPCVPRLCYIVLRSCIYQPHSLISDIYRRIYISVMMGPALRTIPLS